MRIRTVRKAVPIPGTNKQIVKTSTVGGMRQMRCGKCQGMMVPGKHHNGSDILKCTSCGTMAGSRPM